MTLSAVWGKKKQNMDPVFHVYGLFGDGGTTVADLFRKSWLLTS